MRRLLAFAAVAACTIACADEDPPPLYVETDYQVRCIDCEPRAADDVVRHVRALDGQDGFRVECTVTEREGDRLLTFSAVYTDPERPNRSYSFGVVQANIDAADPGGSCRVTVSEGNNSYEGDCTADSPNDEEPCELQLELEDEIVIGSVLCENVPNKNTAMITRHLVEPNGDEPAEFEVHGCRGL
jgi:hypothetical protein